MADFLLGAQMFTLREHCTDHASTAEACRRVREMGYDGIQPSAAYFNEIEPAALRQILEENGLECSATHRPLDQVEETASCVAYHQALGTDLVAIGGWHGGDWTAEAWSAFAERFSRAADALAESGLRLGYHNHAKELACLSEDRAALDPENTPLEILRRACGENVWFEIDTYWIAHGGGDPAAWIEKCADRATAVHVKDFTTTPEQAPVMCEVGAGNLNWPAILEACEAARTRWLLVERDQGELDPFRSLEISCRNLRKMLGRDG